MHYQSYWIFIVKKYSLKTTQSFLKDRRLAVLTRILREAMVVSTCHTLWDRYGERVAGTYIYGVSGSRPSFPPSLGYHTSGWSHHCWRNSGQHSTCGPAPPTPLTFHHPPSRRMPRQFLPREDRLRRWFQWCFRDVY